MKSLRIKERDSNLLLLSRSKKSEFIGLLISVFIVGSIFYSVFGRDIPEIGFINSIIERIKDQPLLLLVLLLPLIVLQKSRDALKVFLVGDKYTFNLATNQINHNDKLIYQFSDIEEIQIRVFKSDDFDSYHLSLMVKSGKPYLLEDHNDLSTVKELAGNIADFIKVPVRVVN